MSYTANSKSALKNQEQATCRTLSTARKKTVSKSQPLTVHKEQDNQSSLIKKSPKTKSSLRKVTKAKTKVSLDKTKVSLEQISYPDTATTMHQAQKITPTKAEIESTNLGAKVEQSQSIQYDASFLESFNSDLNDAYTVLGSSFIQLNTLSQEQASYSYPSWTVALTNSTNAGFQTKIQHENPTYSSNNDLVQTQNTSKLEPSTLSHSHDLKGGYIPEKDNVSLATPQAFSLPAQENLPSVKPSKLNAEKFHQASVLAQNAWPRTNKIEKIPHSQGHLEQTLYDYLESLMPKQPSPNDQSLSTTTALNLKANQDQGTQFFDAFTLFSSALNTIVLNKDQRTIVEQALEEIIQHAAPIFEAEYKTFFYTCYYLAPQALFWMLQYQFYTDFFMLSEPACNAVVNKNTVWSRHLFTDLPLIGKISSLDEDHQALRERFAQEQIPSFNLHEHLLLNLYEELYHQKSLLAKRPHMTQRELIRHMVKHGGMMPEDPAKTRLKALSSQIYALNNLRLNEIRQMGSALAKLSRTPRRLQEIFGSDFKHYSMPQQQIAQKMNSWTTMFPQAQSCMLVQLDPGINVRSLTAPEKIYNHLSLKEHKLVILHGLEVCYCFEHSTTSATSKTKAKQKLTQGSLSANLPQYVAASQLQQESLDDASKSFSLLSQKVRQSKAQNARHQQSTLAHAHKAKVEHQPQASLFSSALHASDFTLVNQELPASDDEWVDFNDEQDMYVVNDSSFYTESKDSPLSQQGHSKRPHVAQDTFNPSKATAPTTLPQNASYISGVFFGTQGAENAEQLAHLNQRGMQVNNKQVGFMVVTL